MELRLRLGIACLLAQGALSLGCPRPPEPSPSPSSPPATPARSLPPSPAPSSSSATAAPTQPDSSPAPTPSAGALPPEGLPLMTQAHPWPGVNLGLERVEVLARPHRGQRREEPAGHLSLGLGQLFFSSDVFAGERVRIGGALLQVLRVEPDSLRFRWLKSPVGAAPPQLRPARPRMRELGLYRFQDGRVLGVGRVTTLAKGDGSQVEVVTLSIFPPNYEQDPLQDYEVLPRLVRGQPLGSSPLGGRRLSLIQLQAAGDEPGWIRVGERR